MFTNWPNHNLSRRRPTDGSAILALFSQASVPWTRGVGGRGTRGSRSVARTVARTWSGPRDRASPYGARVRANVPSLESRRSFCARTRSARARNSRTANAWAILYYLFSRGTAGCGTVDTVNRVAYLLAFDSEIQRRAVLVIGDYVSLSSHAIAVFATEYGMVFDVEQGKTTEKKKYTGLILRWREQHINSKRKKNTPYILYIHILRVILNEECSGLQLIKNYSVNDMIKKAKTTWPIFYVCTFLGVQMACF